MKKNILVTVVAFLICLMGAAGAAAQDAAMVVDVQGAPATYESEEKKGQEVMLMDFLLPGDRIKLDDNSVIILNYFASGAREEITGPGVITVEMDGSHKEGQTKVVTAMVDYMPPAIRQGQMENQSAGMVVLRSALSAVKKIEIIFPNKCAVRGTPIKFAWYPIEETVKYHFSLVSASGEILMEEDTKFTSVEYFNDLEPGAEFVWVVKATTGRQVTAKGTAKFYILTEQEIQKINLTEEFIKKNYTEGSDQARIAQALLYEKFHLNAEAEAILLDLKKDHPENRNIVRIMNSLKDNYRE